MVSVREEFLGGDVSPSIDTHYPVVIHYLDADQGDIDIADALVPGHHALTLFKVDRNPRIEARRASPSLLSTASITAVAAA
jgi:hypothetical protein